MSMVPNVMGRSLTCSQKEDHTDDRSQTFVMQMTISPKEAWPEVNMDKLLQQA